MSTRTKHNYDNKRSETPEEDIEIDALCGEIYFTIQRNIIFYCTLCSEKTKDFQHYFDHLKDKHITDSCAFEVCSENNELENDEIYDYVCLKDTETESEATASDDSNDLIEMGEEMDSFEDLDSNTTKTLISVIPSIEEKNENTFSPSTSDTDERFEFMDLLATSNKKTNSYPAQNKTKTLHRRSSSAKSQTIGQNDVAPSEKTNKLLEGLSSTTDTRPVRKRVVCNKVDNAERPHKCPICGAAFKDNNNMRGHMRRHSKEKRFECPQCLKKFYTGSEVNVHMRTHTGLRPFLCSQCGRTFQTNYKLTDHIKRHNNQRDFKCSHCMKAFFDSDTLRDHLKCHSHERPYECKICSAKFIRPNALANHMKLHANKREYSCSLCSAAFNQQAGLFSHMKATHKKI